MATAFSQPTQFTPYVENWDKDLVQKALMYKQGKYDLNRQKIQSTINSAISLDLAKDEDADYLYGKLKETLDVVNQYGSGDLSLDSRTDYLQGHISSVADDNVMNGYLGTLKLRNIQKEAAAAKKDGLYSDLNFAYSMQDAQKWLTDGTVGSEYSGNSSYVPYSDNNKKFLDIIKELKPNVTAVRRPNGQYEYYSENEVIEPATIKGAIELLLDSDPMAARQMQVNAWGQFQGMDDNTFFANVGTTVNSLRNGVQEDIKKLEQQKDKIGNNTNPKAIELQKLIDYQNEQLKYVEKLSTDRTALENFIYKKSTLNGYADVFAVSRTKSEITTNDGYWKQLDYDLANKKLLMEKGSKMFDVYKEINALKSDKKYAEAEGLWNIALDNGILPTKRIVNGQEIDNTYTNDIVNYASNKLVATGQVINEDVAIDKLQDLNQKNTEQYSDLSNKVRNLLQHRSDIDINTYIKGNNTTPTPLIPTGGSPVLGASENILDLDASIAFLQSKNTYGEYTDVIREYKKLQGNITKVTEAETSIKNLATPKVSTWLNNPTQGSTFKIGDEGVIYDNGQYYRTKKELVFGMGPSGTGSASGGTNYQYIKQEMLTPSQVMNFVQNKTAEGQNDIYFNDINVIPVENIKKTAEGFLTSNMTGVIANTQTYNVNTQDPNSMIMFGEAMGIINAKGYKSNKEGDMYLFNQDLDKLKENYLNPSATVDKPMLDKPINMVFDQENDQVLITVGSGEEIETVAIPRNELSSAPTLLNQYNRLVNEFETQGLLEAEKIKINTNINKAGGKTTELIDNVLLPIGDFQIPISVNIVGTKNNEVYSYSPSYTFDLDGKTIVLSQEDLAPFYNTPLVSSNFDNIYTTTTSISSDVIIAAYKRKYGIK